MEFVEFKTNNYTYTDGEIRDVELIIEAGVYSKNSQIVLNFEIAAVNNEQIVYFESYAYNVLKTELRLDNIMRLNCESLAELQLDNFSSDSPVDNFLTNLYDNDANEQNFLTLNPLKTCPTIFSGNNHELYYKFVDFFPCFNEDIIVIKNQMIINFEYLCEAPTLSITNVNAVNPSVIADGSFFSFSAQMINFKNFNIEQPIAYIYCDEEELKEVDNDYFINVGNNEEVYSIIVSMDTNPEDLTVTEFELYVNELPIIEANSTIDFIEQVKEYRTNDQKWIAINLKEVIEQPFNVYVSVVETIPLAQKVYVTYFMRKRQ